MMMMMMMIINHVIIFQTRWDCPRRPPPPSPTPGQCPPSLSQQDPDLCHTPRQDILFRQTTNNNNNNNTLRATIISDIVTLSVAFSHSQCLTSKVNIIFYNKFFYL